MKKSTMIILYYVATLCIFLILLSLCIPKRKNTEFFYAGQENTQIATAVESIVQKFNIKSICEVSCGNSAWVPILLDKMPSLTYKGYDKSKALINEGKTFLAKYNNASNEFIDDLFMVKPSPCDLIISQNFLQTLSYQDIKKAILHFATFDTKFFAIVNYFHSSADNRNIKTGGKFNMNLELHPFNMSPALAQDIGDTNLNFFIYTLSQIQGISQNNAFWKANIAPAKP